MEAFSVEDDGEGISFHVYAYNVQPGVSIDYATGENQLAVSGENIADSLGKTDNGEGSDYVLNTNTKKFHKPTCESVFDMREKNKKEVFSTREGIIAQGYEPCGKCKP